MRSISKGIIVEEQKIIRKLSLTGILGNVFLSAFKLFAGIFGKSGAMVSDAVHSLSDVFATLIAYIGVKLSKQPEDAEHPYGHERLECVASLILGLILAGTGIAIGYAGIRKLFFSEGSLEIPTMLPLIAVDPVAGLVICALILKVAYDISRDAVSKMLDTSCSDAFEQKLRTFIQEQPGVEQIDLLHTRLFGNKVYVDLEIRVRRDISLVDAHSIAESVHSSVEKRFPNVKHIMIHINPDEKDPADQPE